MTRAKDQLHVLVPQRFYTHSQRAGGYRHVYAPRTRFIPNSLLRHFGCGVWPMVKKAAEPTNIAPQTPASALGEIESHALLGDFITIMCGFRFSVHPGLNEGARRRA